MLARGDRVLVLEIVPGRPIWQMNGHPQARAAATTLEQIVDVMHAAGVYHFDLRKRDNILVTDAGEVYIIDFTTAVAPRRYGPLGWLLRPVAALVDHYALLKWKDLLCPEELTPRESRLLHLLNHTRPGRHRRSR